jgi:hypothetical protein
MENAVSRTPNEDVAAELDVRVIRCILEYLEGSEKTAAVTVVNTLDVLTTWQLKRTLNS